MKSKITEENGDKGNCKTYVQYDFALDEQVTGTIT